MNETYQTKIVHAYNARMYEILERYDVIIALVDKQRTSGSNRIDVETIGLNFRKIAEIIVYANLAGHEAEYISLYPKYQHDWRLKQIMNNIRAINPDFYPKSLEVNNKQKEDKIPEIINLADGLWMTEDELIKMYDNCGDLLHAQSPFSPVINLNKYNQLFIEWSNKLSHLLNHHVVILANSDYGIWTQMRAFGTGQPQSSLRRKAESYRSN